MSGNPVFRYDDFCKVEGRMLYGVFILLFALIWGVIALLAMFESKKK